MKELEQRQKNLLRDMEREEKIKYLDYLVSQGYDVSMFDCRVGVDVPEFQKGGVISEDAEEIILPNIGKLGKIGDTIELPEVSTFHKESKMLIKVGWSDYIVANLYTPTPKHFMIVKIATSVLNDQRQKQANQQENILDYLSSRANLKMFSIDENMLNGVTHIKLEICQ